MTSTAETTRPGLVRHRRTPSRQLVRALPPICGVLGVLLAWVILARALDLGDTLPQPWIVIEHMWQDRQLLLTNTGPTLRVAAEGFILGNLGIVPFVLLAMFIPSSESLIVRIAVAIHIIPLIALAPIVIVSLSGSVSNVVITAFLVYYPSLIAILLGLHAANPSMLELIRSVGGTRASEIRKVRLRAALPNIFGGLLIAVPASLLGALVAEFFGGSSGLGGLLVESQRSLNSGRAWAVAAYLGLFAVILYTAVALLRNWLIPWAKGEQATDVTLDTESGPQKRMQGLISLATAAVLVLVSWQALVSVFGVDDAIAKRPVQVFKYLTADAANDGFWADAGPAMGRTFWDALVGFSAGMIGATILALLMVSFGILERALMPIIIVVRSLPLLALTPLIVLVFGRGLVTVGLVGGLISFFPTLINLMVALQSAPQTACDVVRAAGGSQLKAALKVRLFYAIPAFTASTRVAVPQAIIGATLAEWLATGKGIGNFIIVKYAVSNFSQVWAAAVLLVIAVMVIYLLIDEGDRLVRKRML